MILQKEIEDKTIVWLAHSNQYLIVENIVAKILHALDSGSSKKKLKTHYSIILIYLKKKLIVLLLILKNYYTNT
ncbi:hypothetical protein R8G61_13230 [Tenacibaculum maritimum]